MKVEVEVKRGSGRANNGHRCGWRRKRRKEERMLKGKGELKREGR